MHVTIYYPGKLPVPPPAYGGGQRVMYWLAKALVQLGHRVTLIAHPDSHVPGVELRPLRHPRVPDASWLRLIPDSTDILHLRHPPGAALPKPYVLTVGGNGLGLGGRTLPANTIFLSSKHAANHQSVHYIHNGVDPDEYECHPARENYAVFLAKASWNVKNLSGAIQVCRRAGVELHVIGSGGWRFGLHRMLPLIRGVQFHGMLGQKEKIPLLSRARCLVFPVRWHEPYGNAVNEALVSGCYVAATPYGSLPEIVTPETGVLSPRAADLAEALQSPARFSPEQCRRRIVEGGLTHLDMARKYLACYERVLTHGRLGEHDEPPPRGLPGFAPKQLLPWDP